MIREREENVRYLLSSFGIVIFALGGALTMLNLSNVVANFGQWLAGVDNFLNGVLSVSSWWVWLFNDYQRFWCRKIMTSESK